MEFWAAMSKMRAFFCVTLKNYSQKALIASTTIAKISGREIAFSRPAVPSKKLSLYLVEHLPGVGLHSHFGEVQTSRLIVGIDSHAQG